MIKKCKNCGTEFEAIGKQIYCSKECAKKGEAKNRCKRNIRYCAHCGDIIPKDSYRRSYCSKECYDKEHLIHMNNKANNIDMDDAYQSEEERLLPPSQEEIYNTMVLLYDFGLKHIKVPKFKTTGELCNWRKQIIHKALTD